MGKRTFDALLHPDAAIAGVWLTLGVTLAALTYRLADWFKLPDEMVFQHLGISIARDHSLIPRIHGESIRSLNQLYPLLISPIVGGGYVADDLPQIRLLNAFLVTSAVIPAYLLARRVSGRRSLGYLIAVLSVSLPWLVLSPFMLTEVVALPAFLWAILAIQHAVVSPAPKHDLIALGAIVLAVSARTQFVLLAGVLPVAVVAFARVTGTWRSLIAQHRLLASVYATGIVAVGILELAGGSVLSLSIYGEQFGRGLVPAGVPGWALGHAADLAFSLGLLPFLVGVAWMLANLVRPAATVEMQAFASVGAAAVAIGIWTVTTFDLQLGGYIFDRYLSYLAPLVLLGFACALLDARLPLWSLAIPVGVVAAGFVLHLQGEFAWDHDRVNSDSPTGVLYRPIVDLAGSRGTATVLLVAATVALAVAFAVAAARLPGRALATALLAVLAIGIPAETGYVLHRFFSADGESGRPLTQSNGGTLDWVDRTVGTHADVTIAPYPVSSDYLVTERYWRDIEFWNKAVTRHIVYPGAHTYSYTGYWFPKTTMRFDEATGRVGGPGTRYVVQSVGESRLRVAGTVIQQTQEAMLIDAGTPWRLAWRTTGLYADGWTKPDTTTRIAVYPAAGQTGPLLHYLSLQLRAPEDVEARAVAVRTNLEQRPVDASSSDTTDVSRLTLCVPATGPAEVTLQTSGSSPIPGVQRTLADSLVERTGGVLVSGIFLGDETGGAC